MSGVYILDGARTAFGRFGGGFRRVTATQLGAAAARGALARSRIAPGAVDHVAFGNVVQSSADAVYLARHVGLAAGTRIECPAVTINRLCGSGLEAAVYGARLIDAGEAEVVLAGGTENMSQAPFVIRGAREGLPLGPASLEDSLWAALTDAGCGLGMAETAENLAGRYRLTREAQDAFAARSHTLAARARAAGRFAEEIVPVAPSGAAAGAPPVEHDEHIRSETTAERLAKLPARFRENGTVTAGNSSGINDGAAAVVLASAGAAERLGGRPLGRLVSWAAVGVPPEIMGIGPVPASREALARGELRLEQMDLVEMNEAFAAQYLAVEAELGLDRARVNPNGGAIALGHPIGASGARLLLTLLYELRHRGGRYGLAALCIGGGQGIAAIVEVPG
ncbi:MAG TPA: acetyl-CoA C-acyltransferase [bacterium]|nr:acetyl-CoA C-acyltransferase [bacterium]